jgi:hypothetical protein
MAMLFMSPEHIRAMNAVLAADESVRAACADLARPVVIGYELTDGPGGDIVYWSVALTDTVRFGLEPTEADLVFRGDWAAMVHAAQSHRQGGQEDAGIVPVGDLSVLESVGPVLALARRVATLPVEFPNS